MFKLSFKLLFSRKKWLLVLVFLFTLVISSVISIFTATDTIKSSLLNVSFLKFGEYSGVLHNLEEKKEDIFEKVSNVGHFILIDSLSISNNKSANIGWVDQNFIDLGHLKLISGDYPTNSNEVAIESYYLNYIDSKWKLGETRNIKIGNESKTLKLVGIVENYSARWTMGQVNFPNIFIAYSTDSLENFKNNYLVGYNHKHSINKNITFIENLMKDYQGNVFLNDKLFYSGLKDNKNVIIISFSVQLIILIVSFFSVLNLLTYFNTSQTIKFSIFKTLGCTKKKLFIITILQTTIIYIFGIILSLPLLFVFHYLIMKNTYGFNLFENIQIGQLLSGAIIWLVLLYIIMAVLSYLSIRKQSQSSISLNLKGGKENTFLFIDKLDQVKQFSIKQLLIQLLTNPKMTLLSILTIAFSILVILLSFTMSKEAAGIWNTKIDYYLTAQELIGTKLINNKTVVVTEGGTFHPSDVSAIEISDGVKYIIKEPFMMDVFPLIEKEILTSSLVSWTEKYNRSSNNQDNEYEVVIPNVKYVLKSEADISKLFRGIDQEVLDNSVIIHIPGSNANENEKLIGKKIVLTKTYVNGSSYKTERWDFNILEVINIPYTIIVDKEETIVRDEIIIIMSENSAIDKKITPGYKDLTIYTEVDLSEERAINIYNMVYALAAGVPGSLFQYIPAVIHDNTRITVYLEFLGKASFYISMILAVSCVYTVIFGKYQLQKKYWGIYRSLGMSTKKVFLYLLLEVLVYYVIATIISSIVYFAFLFLNNTAYPTMYYIFFMISIYISTLFMLIAATIFVKLRVDQDSIASLIKVVE